MASAGPSPVHALVLRGTDIGETSRLVSLFTAEHARLTVRARGLRRRGSKHAAVLEPFNIIEARILHREGAEVHLFTEGVIVQSNDPVRRDVTRAAVASVWLEVLEHTDCDPGDAPATLSWAQTALAALAEAADAKGLGILLAWQLLGHLGHQPLLDRCIDTGDPPREPMRFHLGLGGLVANAESSDPLIVPLGADLVGILRSVPGTPPARLARVRLSAAQAKRLLDLFDRFCQFQLELRLRSLRFLQSLEAVR
jgi:DNA repair protein RecO (recombination protein O)